MSLDRDLVTSVEDSGLGSDNINPIDDFCSPPCTRIQSRAELWHARVGRRTDESSFHHDRASTSKEDWVFPGRLVPGTWARNDDRCSFEEGFRVLVIVDA